MEIKNFMITKTDTELGTRFMAAEPLLGPIFKRQKSVFISDIKKVVS